MTERLRVLDLFAGEGGAGRGYLDAGFEVVAVDNHSRVQRHPADMKVMSDWLKFLRQFGRDFDLIHASPPCTGYSRGTAAVPDRLDRYDRLIAAVRDELRATERPYIIENVEGARSELLDPITLCWTQFYRPASVVDDDGTPLWMKRHRLFESNMPLSGAGRCAHPKRGFGSAGWVQCAGAYRGRRDKVAARTIRKGGYVPSSSAMARLMHIDWMTKVGMTLAIPPVYTQFLGNQVLQLLEVAA